MQNGPKNSHTEDVTSLSREDLLSCVELGKALTSELDSRKLFGKLLKRVSELIPAENWSLMLLDESTGELRFELSVDLDLDLVRDVRLRLGEGIAGKVALQQTPMIVQDVQNCDFFSQRVDGLSGNVTRSVVCVPLIFGGKTLGVIEVVNPSNLGNRALPLLSIVADYAAIAVENMRQYRQIHDLAVHDNLTGLFNQRYLYDTLKSAIETSAAGNTPLSLIFMDIDHFKHVVDTFGHLKGSEALQEVAGTIRKCLVEPAYGVAYGGDEFVVVLPGLDREAALRKAEEIRSLMSQTMYLTAHGHQVPLRASFGLATYPEDAADLSGILALADQAMFDVKRTGKNAVRHTGFPLAP
jgi:diguanylate cyclase (GGDEF)-like protein